MLEAGLLFKRLFSFQRNISAPASAQTACPAIQSSIAPIIRQGSRLLFPQFFAEPSVSIFDFVVFVPGNVTPTRQFFSCRHLPSRNVLHEDCSLSRNYASALLRRFL